MADEKKPAEVKLDTREAKKSLLELARAAKTFRRTLEKANRLSIDTTDAEQALMTLRDIASRSMLGIGQDGADAFVTISETIESARRQLKSLDTEAPGFRGMLQALKLVREKVKSIRAEASEAQKGTLDDFTNVIESIAAQAFAAPIDMLADQLSEFEDVASGLGRFDADFMGHLDEARGLLSSIVDDQQRAASEVAEGLLKGLSSTDLLLKHEDKIAKRKEKLAKLTTKNLRDEAKAIEQRQVFVEEMLDQVNLADRDLYKKSLSKLRTDVERALKEKGASRSDVFFAKNIATPLKYASGKFDLEKIPIINSVLGNLNKVSFMFSAVGALVMALLGLEEKVKGLNSKIVDLTAGRTRLLDFSDLEKTADAQVRDALNILRGSATNVEHIYNRLGMRVEEVYEAGTSLQAQGDDLRTVIDSMVTDVDEGTYRIVDGMKRVKPESQVFADALRESAFDVQTFATLTGKSVQDIGEMMSELHDSMVVPFQDTDDVMSVLVDDMLKSSLGADRFFTSLRNITQQSKLYSSAVTETSKILKVMGKSTMLSADGVTTLVQDLSHVMSTMSAAQVGGLEKFGANLMDSYRRDREKATRAIARDVQRLRDSGVAESTIELIQQGSPIPPEIMSTLSQAQKDIMAEIQNFSFTAEQLQMGMDDYFTRLKNVKYLSPMEQMSQILAVVAKGDTSKSMRELAKIDGKTMEILNLLGIAPEMVDAIKRLAYGIDEDMRATGQFTKENAMTLGDFNDLLASDKDEVSKRFEDLAKKMAMREEAISIREESRPITEAIKLALDNVLYMIADTLADIRDGVLWLVDLIPGFNKPSRAEARGAFNEAQKVLAPSLESMEKELAEITKQMRGASPAQQSALDERATALEESIKSTKSFLAQFGDRVDQFSQKGIEFSRSELDTFSEIAKRAAAQGGGTGFLSSAAVSGAIAQSTGLADTERKADELAFRAQRYMPIGGSDVALTWAMRKAIGAVLGTYGEGEMKDALAKIDKAGKGVKVGSATVQIDSARVAIPSPDSMEIKNAVVDIVDPVTGEVTKSKIDSLGRTSEIPAWMLHKVGTEPTAAEEESYKIDPDKISMVLPTAGTAAGGDRPNNVNLTFNLAGSDESILPKIHRELLKFFGQGVAREA